MAASTRPPCTVKLCHAPKRNPGPDLPAVPGPAGVSYDAEAMSQQGGAFGSHDRVRVRPVEAFHSVHLRRGEGGPEQRAHSLQRLVPRRVLSKGLLYCDDVGRPGHFEQPAHDTGHTGTWRLDAVLEPVPIEESHELWYVDGLKFGRAVRRDPEGESDGRCHGLPDECVEKYSYFQRRRSIEQWNGGRRSAGARAVAVRDLS